MFLLFISCSAPQEASSYEALDNYIAIASVSMDYAVGTLATLDLETFELQESISTISGDPLVLYEEKYFWQINRFQYDTIRRYDPRNLTFPLVEVSLRQDELSSSNPQDAHLCADKLFLSQYDQNSLLVLDPETLEQLNSIELSELSSEADQDGLLELSDMVVIEERLYVAAQGLNRQAGWSSIGSQLIELDCAAEELISAQSFGANVQLFEHGGEGLLLASQSWEAEAAGLFTLTFGAEPVRIATVPSETSYEHVVASEDRILYTILSEDYSEYQVYCGSFEEQELILSTEAFITSVALNGDGVWIGTHWGWNDPEEHEPSLSSYSLNECRLTVEPIRTTLAPYSLAFVHSEGE
jgi:hypothetical protein